MKTVLIIVGAARSGSTLLAKALGGHSTCFALGEINRFNNEINNPETHCGCAEKLHDCNFWDQVKLKLKEDTGEPDFNTKSKEVFDVGIFDQLTKQKKYKLFSTIMFGSRYASKTVDPQIENTFTLYKAIFEQSKASVLIDSSKGLFRALVLLSRAKDHNMQVKLVQLTRDGRGVLNSGLKSSYKVLHKDGELKTYHGVNTKNSKGIIRSWMYINLRNFLLLKLFFRKSTTFVKYEDFTAHPKQILGKIYNSLSLNYEEQVVNLGKNENHILGGNSSRINAKVIKKQDDAWRKNLSFDVIKQFNVRAGWFNKILGYK